MLNKLKTSTLAATLRMGAFIGWYLTVMYICEQSLHYYHDDTLLASVNTTFLIASVLTCSALVVVLLLLDVEGVLSNSLLRWLPGVFMAECGIALSLANAATMTVFAAFAGVAAAFGALAVLSHLLRVKVGQRMFAIGGALAIGGVIRLVAALVISSRSQSGLVPVAVAVGVITALAVHSEGYSRTGGSGALVSLAEAPPKTIISKVPFVYIVLFFCCTAFYFSHGHSEAMAVARFSSTFGRYDQVAYVAFILAAIVVALVIRVPQLPMLLLGGVGLATAAALAAGLPYLTAPEAGVFALLNYTALACFRASIYLFIVIFSLDRPHPLFYATFGYALAIAGELTGRVLDRYLTTLPAQTYIIVLFVLMPVGATLVWQGLNRHGFSQAKLEHRHKTSQLIKQKSLDLELFDRERMMVEEVVLNGCDVDELAGKMLFSRNTVRVLLRPIFDKFGVADIEALRGYFTSLTDNEEQFMAQVHAAEDEKRAEQRREKNRERINTLRDKYEKLDAARAEKLRLKAERAAKQESATAELRDEPGEAADAAAEPTDNVGNAADSVAEPSGETIDAAKSAAEPLAKGGDTADFVAAPSDSKSEAANVTDESTEAAAEPSERNSGATETDAKTTEKAAKPIDKPAEAKEEPSEARAEAAPSNGAAAEARNAKPETRDEQTAAGSDCSKAKPAPSDNTAKPKKK